LSALTLDHIFRLLEEYVRRSGRRLDVLLIGRLALYAYGSQEAPTEDVDAELAQDVEEVCEQRLWKRPAIFFEGMLAQHDKNDQLDAGR
jgi:hypothetical protein